MQMTFEEAGLISNDPVVNSILRKCASHNVNAAKLQAIKFVLEYEGPMHMQDAKLESGEIVSVVSHELTNWKSYPWHHTVTVDKDKLSTIRTTGTNQ
jgi:hypothetical protein